MLTEEAFFRWARTTFCVRTPDLPHADTRSSRNDHTMFRSSTAILRSAHAVFRMRATWIPSALTNFPEDLKQIPELSDRRPSLLLRVPEVEIFVGKVLCPQHLQNAASEILRKNG